MTTNDVYEVCGYCNKPVELGGDIALVVKYHNKLVAALEGARRFIGDVIRNHAGDVPDAYTVAAETYAEHIDALLARVRGEEATNGI